MTDVQLSFPCPDEPAPAEDDETAAEPVRDESVYDPETGWGIPF